MSWDSGTLHCLHGRDVPGCPGTLGPYTASMAGMSHAGCAGTLGPYTASTAGMSQDVLGLWDLTLPPWQGHVWDLVFVYWDCSNDRVKRG